MASDNQAGVSSGAQHATCGNCRRVWPCGCSNPVRICDLCSGDHSECHCDDTLYLEGTQAAPRASIPVPDFVLGFMFDPALEKVALIRKKPRRPDQQWQAGLLNGIGGGIERGELAPQAMVREFLEEGGVRTEPDAWYQFDILTDAERCSWRVFVFAAIGNLDRVRSVERERIEVLPVSEITATRGDLVESLPRLIAQAIRYLGQCRPA